MSTTTIKGEVGLIAKFYPDSQIVVTAEDYVADRHALIDKSFDAGECLGYRYGWWAGFVAGAVLAFVSEYFWALS